MSGEPGPSAADRRLREALTGYRGPQAGTADLWWLPISALRQQHLELLDPVERKRAQTYLRDADRNRFVLGVALSRLVLGAILATPAAEVALDRECVDCGRPHGRPRVATEWDENQLDFSVSHSGSWLALLVGRGVRVGVDVEELADAADLPSVARNVLADAELADVHAGGGFDVERFFRYWVAKESALKATGDGLGESMKEVAVMPLAQSSGRIEFGFRPGAVATAQRLDAPDGYVAAATTLTADVVAIRRCGDGFATRITGG